MNSVILAVAYLVMDAMWIYAMTPLLYGDLFASVQKKEMRVNWKYGALAYVVLLFALFMICVPLSSTYTKHKWLAFSSVGFVLYAVYNLTNAAVFSEYTPTMVLVDTMWGTSVFSVLGWLHLTLS